MHNTIGRVPTLIWDALSASNDLKQGIEGQLNAADLEAGELGWAGIECNLETATAGCEATFYVGSSSAN